MNPKIPLPGPVEKPKRYLKQFGFERYPWWRTHKGLLILLLIIIFAIGGFWLFRHGTFRGIELDSTQIAMALLSLGAVGLAYQQWREAREEASMERYYDRLDMANRRRECSPEDVHGIMKNSIPALAEEKPTVLMYVYVELDNLEYVAGKYRLGYMRPGQAFRGLRTFQRRCLSPEFRRIAGIRACEGGDYHRFTVNIVKYVCEQMEAEIARIADETARTTSI